LSSGILTGFEDDKKEFHSSISPFLSDAEIEEEEQESIINALWIKLKGEAVATPKTKVIHFGKLFTPLETS
jgi:hypothetical protein